jgi:mono/diheme cytochrome c family protein
MLLELSRLRRLIANTYSRITMFGVRSSSNRIPLISPWVLLAMATFVLMVAGPDTLSAKSDDSRNPLLTQPQAGQVLIAELRCVACHGAQAGTNFLEKSAPDLADVGSRIAPDYLLQFLLSPSSCQPGTSMPDMLASMSDSNRHEIAEALTHFLISQSANEYEPGGMDQLDPKAGHELFHTVGCVACHAPREVIEMEVPETEFPETELPEVPGAENGVDRKGSDRNGGVGSEGRTSTRVTLAHLAKKYSFKSLSEFLFHPLTVRGSGRMPDMKLTMDEAQSLAKYLLGDSYERRASLKPQAKWIELGRKSFQQLNCAASQVQAIKAAVQHEAIPDSDEVAIKKTLTAFNCFACHVRDNLGGVAKERNAFFRTSEKNLGDDGRIPPPLTLVGAKLQPVWLKKVLFDGESVRHYMHTRMPQYGEKNLRHLPDLLSRVDTLESVDLHLPSPESQNKSEQEREKKLRAGGRELLGDQGLNCIACHNFNGKPSPLHKGMDLITTYQRLQPAWFNNFLRNPGAYRPRIVMPYSWPDGVAAHKSILDGDTELQIQAIWYNLSLGTSAADPPGIRRQETKLSVADTARTYRGRSSVAGFRGIAVGFPEKISYAFNAETGTLSAIWRGEFIRVDRGGQGSGGFNPAGKAVQLSQDVSFIEPLVENMEWPARPVMTKEAPVNPNPLYPKNLGYQFVEYSLDELSIPTFVYRSGAIAISDRSTAVRLERSLLLKRTIRFNAPSAEKRWFRAMAGEIEEEKEHVFRTRSLRLTVSGCTTTLRRLADDSKDSELILKFEFEPGESVLELTYEPLDP